MLVLLQDLGYAFRQLRKHPGFAITAILTLALGIGATTAVFSVAYGVLIDPFPYKDVHTLATPKLCSSRWPQCRWSNYSAESFNQIARSSTIFSGMTASTISNVVLLGSGEPQRVRGNFITPNTFDVLGVQPILGRASIEDDVRPGHGEVALLSYRYWQGHYGGDPSVLGRVLSVVGVISDQLDSFLGFREDYPQIFIPYTVAPLANSMIVSTALPAAELLNPVRQAVYSIDKDQPIVDATTLRQMLDMYGYAGPRFALALFGTLAAAALLLALVGIYGVLSFVTSQRTQEIGIRMALRANRANVMWMVLRQACLLALMGVAAGLPLAFAAGRFARGELIHTSPYDPLALLVVVPLLPLLAIAGTWLPARRAAAIDPVRTLRSE
jgi:hypothetical protein